MKATRPLLAAALLLLAGCSAPPSARQQDAEAEARYAHRVAPFAVQDASGTPYTFPFLGGFDVPRPQIVDIDQDGDRDLFVQEHSDELIFFENTGTADSTHLVWRTDRYKDLAVGDWYRFVDLSGDGAPDLLAEEPFSYVRYYRNTGTADGEATFELVADTLKTIADEPLFSDRQNIPNVADIDCDGQPDLFVGRLDGTITRYEATGSDEDDSAGADSGTPRFRLVTDHFEDIEIVAQVSQPGTDAPERPTPGQDRPPLPGEDAPLPGGSARHGANTMAFADVDGDGDTDLLWGDYFEPGLLLLENTGSSCENPNFRTEPRPFPPSNPVSTSGYNAPAVGDLTGDARRDLLVGVLGGAYNPDRTTRANLYFYEQTAGGTYARRTRRYLRMIDVGSQSVPAAGDLDGDGDVDLLLGSKIAADGARTGRVYHFENTGTPTAPSYRLRGALDLPDAYNYAPALADLDADGDLDLVAGTWNSGLRLHRNTGTPQQPQFAPDAAPLVELTRGSHATPALVDLDADGDLDLMIGETSGTLNFYRNTGTPQEAQFELVSDTYGGIDVGRRSAPALRDVDGDGDADLLVGSEGDGLAYFQNTGTPQEPQFTRTAGRFALPVPDLTAPVFADVDGDGDADLFSGTTAGGLLFFERRGPEQRP